MGQKKMFKNTSMIVINVGDQVLYKLKNKVGIVKHIRLVPNGNFSTDHSLIAVLCVDYIEEQGRVIATSDKFEVMPEFEYDEEYPSQLLWK